MTLAHIVSRRILAWATFFLLLPWFPNTASAQTLTAALADASTALSNAKAAYLATPPAPSETVKKGGIDWMLAESQELINEATSASSIAKANLARDLANDATAAVGNPGYGARQVLKPEWLPAIASTSTNPGYPSLFTITTYNTVTPSNPLMSNGTAPGTADAMKLSYAICHGQSPVMGNATGVTALLSMLQEGFQATSLTQGERWGEQNRMRAYLVLKFTYPTVIPTSIDTAWKNVMRSRAEQVRTLFNWAFTTSNYLQNSWLNADAREIPNLGYYAHALNDSSYIALMENYMPKVYLTLQPDGATNYTGYQNEAWTYHAEGITVMAWYRYFAPTTTQRQIADDYVKKCGAYHPLTTHRFIHEEYTAPEQKHYWNKLRPQQSFMGYVARDPHAVAACQDNSSNHLLAFTYDPTVFVRSPATVTLPDNYNVFDRNIIGVRGKYGLTDYALTSRDFTYFPGKTTSTGTTTPVKGFGVTTFLGMRRMYTTTQEAALPSATRWPNNAILERVMNRVVVRDASGNITAEYNKGQDITSSISMAGNVAALTARYKTSRNNQNSSWTAIPYDNLQSWVVTPERAVGFMRIESTGSASRTEINSGFDFVSGREGQWGVRKTFMPLSDPSYADGDITYPYSPGVNHIYQYGDLQLSVLGASYTQVKLSYAAGSVLSPATDKMKGTLRLLTPGKSITAGANDWCFVEVRPLATSTDAGSPERLTLSGGLYGFRFVENGRSYTLVQNSNISTTTTLEYTAPAGYSSYSLHLGSDSNVDRMKYLTRSHYDAAMKNDSGWRTTALASNVVSYSIPPGRHILIVGSNATADHASGWKYYPDVFVPNRPLSSLEQWQKTTFGSIAGEGLSNPLSDADADGEVNALEYATAQDPAAATAAVVSSALNGANTEFTYKRSKSAKTGGTTYQIEYTDNISGGVWSSSGIDQEPAPLTDDGTSQTLKILVSTSPGRVIRLKITVPGMDPLYLSAPGNNSGLWIGPASSTWGLGSNWLEGVPAQGVDMDATFGVNATLIVTNDAVRTVGSLMFPAGSYTLAGSNLGLQKTSGSPDIFVESGAAANVNLTLSVNGALTKSGAGTLTISKATSNADSIDIAAGRLKLAANLTNTGTSDNSLTVRPASVLELSNTSAVGANWTLNMTGGETIVSAGSANVWSGPVVLTGSNNRWNITSGQLNLSGGLSGTPGFHKNGGGTLQLSTANLTYTGGSNLNTGTLLASHADALARSTVNMNGGSLAFGVTAATFGALQTTNTSRNIVLQDNSASPQPVTLSIGASDTSTTYAGTFTGPGSIVKTGSGTLNLTSSQSFPGVTSVNQGTLALGGNLAGALTVNGGTIAPQASPTISGDASLSINSTLRIRINGTAAGTQYDQLQAAAAVSLNGTPEIIAASGLPLNSTSYTILNKTSTGAINGTFANLAENALFDSGGYLWRVSYLGGTGNDVSITPTEVMTAETSWRFANFGTTANSGNAADSADPDNDALTNATERTNGTNPNVADVPLVTITSPVLSPVTLPSISNALELAGNADFSGTGTLPAAWTRVSGPGNVTFENPSSFTTRGTFSTPGTYVIRLSAISGSVTGTADLTVFVAPPAELTFRQGVNTYTHTATMIRGDGSFATYNSGSRNEMLIGRNNASMRGLLSFDLSSLPSGLTPSAVKLDLWTSGASGTLASTLQLHRLYQEPAEGTGSGLDGNNAATGCNWTRRTDATTNDLWKAAGAAPGADPASSDFAPTAISSIGSSPPATGLQTTFPNSEAFVSSVTTALTADKKLNMLVIAPEHEAASSNHFFRFHSDDATTVANRPLLTITLAPPAPLPNASTGTAPSPAAGAASALSASATGASSTYWSLVSGPGAAEFGDESQPDTSVTFDAPGNYLLRFTASNDNGSVSSTLAVSVISTATAFETWQSLHWPGNSDPAVTGLSADPDGDGLNNLLEFATGTLPKTPGGSSVSLSRSANLLEFIYPRSHAAVADRVEFIVEWSDALGNDWSDAGVTHAAVPDSDNANTQLWKAKLPAGSGKRFVRLKVQYP